MVGFLPAVPSPEHFHRPSIDDLDDSDNSHEKTREQQPVVDEVVLSRRFNGEPQLNLADAHATADEEAKKRSLVNAERLDFIKDFHEQNHQHTKNRALAEIRASVSPDPADELTNAEKSYYETLNQSLDEVFSGEPFDLSLIHI